VEKVKFFREETLLQKQVRRKWQKGLYGTGTDVRPSTAVME